MKILFLTDNFPPEVNASASRVYERAVYWVRWGHDVTVITSVPNYPQGKVYEGYKNKWHQTEIIDGIRVVRVKTFISKNEGFLLRIIDFLSYMIMAFFVGLGQKKADLVIASSPQFFTAVGAWALAGVKRVPFVFELADLWPASILAVGAMRHSFIMRLLEKLELFLYRRSAAIVALTQAFKTDLIKRGINSQKIFVVINGVDLSRYSPRVKDTTLLNQYNLQGKFIVGYIGTHGMAHGLENVLSAAELLKNYSNIQFLFVGDGAEREHLIQLAQNKNLINVLFVPAQKKALIPNYWSLCDVALVHLRNTEVFTTVIPSKIFEAMAMGLAIILVAPKGEASAIIEKEKIGIWLPAEQPALLADAVIKLDVDTEIRKRFAEASYASAPLHSREHQAKSMLEVLEQVIKH